MRPSEPARPFLEDHGDPIARRTFVVAELSANHNHDLERAKATIDAIATTGADAIKFQTYRPDSLTLDLSTGHFAPRTEGLWKGWRPYDLYRKGALPYGWHQELFAHVRDHGMVPFSTPFDLEGVDLLESLGCPIYKVASLEITHLPLIGAIAATGKPIVLSTGAATLADIEDALDTIGRDRRDVTILKCTTAYPTPYAEVNLRSMQTLATTFGTAVGLSDHTPGHTVAVAAVALGASMIEKHVTLDRNDGGIDAEFSMEPHEFQAMVAAIRVTEAALGDASYRLSASSQSAHARTRSLFVAEHVPAGAPLDASNVRVVRPGAGLHPRYFARVLRARAACDLEPGTALAWNHVDEAEP
jgi:pseudaminic acid synthase